MTDNLTHPEADTVCTFPVPILLGYLHGRSRWWEEREKTACALGSTQHSHRCLPASNLVAQSLSEYSRHSIHPFTVRNCAYKSAYKDICVKHTADLDCGCYRCQEASHDGYRDWPPELVKPTEKTALQGRYTSSDGTRFDVRMSFELNHLSFLQRFAP